MKDTIMSSSSTPASSPSKTQQQHPKKQHRSLLTRVAFFLLLCCCVTIVTSLFHLSILDQHQLTTSDAGRHPFVASSSAAASIEQSKPNVDNNQHHEPIHGLNCDRFGGPPPEIAAEMVYWKDIPRDNHYMSPYSSSSSSLSSQQVQYMTFEPDGGGFNNIRMSMETVLAIAVATGRVLVLPPSQHMYLLGKTTFSFADFFPLHQIADEHDGLRIITMQQFLEETTGKFTLRDGSKLMPPDNRTSWDGESNAIKATLNPWLRDIANDPAWDPDRCIAVFPASSKQEDVDLIKSTFEELLENPPTIDSFVNHPVPLNGSLIERLGEFRAGRSELCIYDTELQKEPLIHFTGKKKLGARLLVHYYAFLFFQSWHEDLWMKRFVRDHVRYVDEIQCAAARIVQAVRERSRQRGQDGIYDSFHIRRGDFQYKKTRVEASEIYDMSKDQIPEGTTVYVGTDERRKDFFADMAKHYDLVFMDDHMDLLKGMDRNLFGMVDQLVVSRGRTFFGCWFSTFTGYINRIRGYHSDKDHAPGYELGILDSYHYALAVNKDMLRSYWPIKRAFYAREFPAAWRHLDADVEQ